MLILRRACKGRRPASIRQPEVAMLPRNPVTNTGEDVSKVGYSDSLKLWSKRFPLGGKT